MRKYENPKLTIISLSSADVLCFSFPFPDIDIGENGKENDTPAYSLF